MVIIIVGDQMSIADTAHVVQKLNVGWLKRMTFSRRITAVISYISQVYNTHGVMQCLVAGIALSKHEYLSFNHPHQRELPVVTER